MLGAEDQLGTKTAVLFVQSNGIIIRMRIMTAHVFQHSKPVLFVLHCTIHAFSNLRAVSQLSIVVRPTADSTQLGELLG